MRRTAVAGLIAGLVATGVGVGAGAAWLASPSPTGGEAVASVSASPVVPASLDEVVAGEGARATSTAVPGLGIDYPDTCVGAAQAAAGWTLDLMSPGQVLEAAADQAGASREVAEKFRQAVEDEVVADSARGTASVSALWDTFMLVSASVGRGVGAKEFSGGRTTPVAFLMDSCEAADKAVVTVVSEISGLPADAETSSGLDGKTFGLTSFALSAQAGQWRVVGAESSGCGFMSSSGADLGGVGEGADITCAFDVDRVPGLAQTLRELSDSELTAASVEALSDRVVGLLGRGSHQFVASGK